MARVVAEGSSEQPRYLSYPLGNYITDVPGECTCGQQGAIDSAIGGDNLSAFQALGNEIADFGCNQTSRFQHTSYFKHRGGDDPPAIAWRQAYQYLHGNKARSALHTFHQQSNGGCRDFTGTLELHDNVIVDQRGAGISFASGGNGLCYTGDLKIFNNVMINVGLGPPGENGFAEAQVYTFNDSFNTTTVEAYNNLVFGWGDDTAGDLDQAVRIDGSMDSMTYIFQNNIFVATRPDVVSYSGPETTMISGSNNFWYYTGADATTLVPPDWDTLPFTDDPALIMDGLILSLSADSPARNSAVDLPEPILRDVYGRLRDCNAVGPVQFEEACAGAIDSLSGQ